MGERVHYTVDLNRCLIETTCGKQVRIYPANRDACHHTLMPGGRYTVIYGKESIQTDWREAKEWMKTEL